MDLHRRAALGRSRLRDLEERVAALLDQHPDAQLAYYAIAHIPLLFLAGYTLSNRRAMLLFENDRYTRAWDLLKHASEAPLLKVAGWPEQIERGVGEVALRVSISYRVTAEVVAEVIPKPLAQLELGLERPQLDAITSDEQLLSYAQAFRQTMDRIHEHLPHLLCRPAVAGIPVWATRQQDDPSTASDL